MGLYTLIFQYTVFHDKKIITISSAKALDS